MFHGTNSIQFISVTVCLPSLWAPFCWKHMQWDRNILINKCKYIHLGLWIYCLPNIMSWNHFQDQKFIKKKMFTSALSTVPDWVRDSKEIGKTQFLPPSLLLDIRQAPWLREFQIFTGLPLPSSLLPVCRPAHGNGHLLQISVNCSVYSGGLSTKETLSLLPGVLLFVRSGWVKRSFSWSLQKVLLEVLLVLIP